MQRPSRAARSLSGERDRSRSSSRIIAIGLALWITLPLGAYTYLAMKTSERSLSPAVEVWAPVEAAGTETRTRVSVVVDRTASVEVFAPSWSGIVEATTFSRGSTVESGDVIATVGGIDRIAYASPKPFTSRLDENAEGDQVAALNEFLRARGSTAPETSEFDRRTLAAVRTFAKSIGVTDPDSVSGFDPGWLVYLPAARVTVDEPALFVGGLAPAPGGVVMTTRPEIAATTLEADATGRRDDGSETIGTPSTRVTAPPESHLHIGGNDLPLTAERDAVDPVAFAVLDSLMDVEATRIEGFVVSESAKGAWSVPSQAIIIDPSGTSCVTARTGASEVVRVDIDVVSVSLGRTTVDAELSTEYEVLVRTAGDDRRC